MTTRQIFTEGMVLIASPDGCQGSWHDQPLLIMRSSQRRSMKQEQGRLRVTEEQEKIDGVHS